MTTQSKHRGPKKRMTEWIRLVATPEDKAMLLKIAEHYKPTEEYNESATVRLIIRTEHARLTAGESAQVS